MLGLALWLDGVAARWDRTESIDKVVLTPWRPSNTHASARTRCTIFWRSWNGISSMHFLASIHSHVPWTRADGKRKRLAGAIGCRSALIRITGDWKMWKDIFKFPQWNETAGLLLSMCCNSGRAQRHWPLSTLPAQAPQTILLAMTELHSCCECLSTGQGAPENSRRFASLHVALETTGVEPCGVEPKVHLFQELAKYRDEDFGGTVAGLGRRRRGPRTIAATGSQVLQRFVGRHQVPVLT